MNRERAVLSEVDLVQVELQDARLGQPTFQEKRERLLVELPGEGLTGRQHRVLDQLLRQGAGTDEIREIAGQVGDGGGGDAPRVDPGMVEEPVILGRQDGLHHPTRNRGERDNPMLAPFGRGPDRQQRRAQRDPGGRSVRWDRDGAHLVASRGVARKPHPHGSTVVRALLLDQGDGVRLHRELTRAPRSVSFGIGQLIEPPGEVAAVERHAGRDVELGREELGRRRRPLDGETRVDFRRERPIHPDASDDQRNQQRGSTSRGAGPTSTGPAAGRPATR